MKNLQRFCAAVVLTFVLTLQASAGHMATGLTDPPPPPTGTQTTTADETQTSVAGDMSTGVNEATANDTVVDTVLSLVGSVLSLI
ncbi:MAG TPA: hypothetical protein VGX48_07165 [Pyrinomonadaceae bacterium]|jgi:hypothetical protein|nr:hypothetical protein [Pyrinomonadaceae bacterium]